MIQTFWLQYNVAQSYALQYSISQTILLEILLDTKILRFLKKNLSWNKYKDKSPENIL